MAGSVSPCYEPNLEWCWGHRWYLTEAVEQVTVKGWLHPPLGADQGQMSV
jgi:hypothetical protein